VNRQVNCRASTSTVMWSAASRSLRTRKTVLTIAIAVTSANGTAVQAISSPVCPWMGGPSESSSGWARNFQTA
jgi:hypothetical protein